MTQIKSIDSFLNHKDKKKGGKNTDKILEAYTNIKIDDKHHRKCSNLNSKSV